MVNEVRPRSISHFLPVLSDKRPDRHLSDELEPPVN
jgi:hypothetical protein